MEILRDPKLKWPRRIVAGAAVVLASTGCHPDSIAGRAAGFPGRLPSVGSEQPSPEAKQAQLDQEKANKIAETLSKGEVYEDATVVAATFAVSPEHQESDDLETVWVPIRLSEQSLGYVKVDPLSCRVTVRIVDASHGELESGYGPSDEPFVPREFVVDLQLVDGATFKPVDPQRGAAEAAEPCIVATTDGSFVGQSEPYLPSRFDPSQV